MQTQAVQPCYGKIYITNMETFETTLTGSDGIVDGIVTVANHASFNKVYQFTSLDDSLHLTIAKDYTGKWIRVAGSEPYFSGWVDELAGNIASLTEN